MINGEEGPYLGLRGYHRNSEGNFPSHISHFWWFPLLGLGECRARGARGARTEFVLLSVERRVRGGEGRSKPTTG